MNFRPQRRDKKLNFNVIRDQFDQIEKTRNINFDPTQFYVGEDASGIYVTLYPTTADVVLPHKLFDLRLSSVMNAVSNSATVVIEDWIQDKGKSGNAILGQQIEIEDGDSIAYDSNISAWVSYPLDGNKWVYLELDRANVKSYIHCSDVIELSTDSLEMIPLHYINTTSDITTGDVSINYDGCVDMRNSIKIDGMA